MFFLFICLHFGSVCSFCLNAKPHFVVLVLSLCIDNKVVTHLRSFKCSEQDGLSVVPCCKPAVWPHLDPCFILLFLLFPVFISLLTYYRFPFMFLLAFMLLLYFCCCHLLLFDLRSILYLIYLKMFLCRVVCLIKTDKEPFSFFKAAVIKLRALKELHTEYH